MPMALCISPSFIWISGVSQDLLDSKPRPNLVLDPLKELDTTLGCLSPLLDFVYQGALSGEASRVLFDWFRSRDGILNFFSPGHPTPFASLRQWYEVDLGLRRQMNNTFDEILMAHVDLREKWLEHGYINHMLPP
jgi:hypothetical protein